MKQKYEPVIGLEVHVELATDSKMFCECPADHFAKSPNSQTCPVCLGLPGALPYANQKAVEDTIKFGLAFGCDIARFSKWDRKHYRYPDLPKGYQISQYDLPLCSKGKWQNIEITRIHLEEDTGKLVHQKVNGKESSLIDYNRSGVPLMEMVTEPDFRDVESISNFLREVQLIVRYLGVSEADMEKGSMRLEANVSVRKVGETKLPDFKVELKNINSFKYLERAVKAEIKRLTEVLESGETPRQETRGYDETKDRTFSQRVKEGSADYRYFPEPDLPPLEISDNDIQTIEKTMPELPEYKREVLRKLELSDHYIDTLVQDKSRVEYFEQAHKLGKKENLSAKLIANVIVNQNLDQKYPEPALLIKYLYELENKDYANGDEVEEAVKKVVDNNTKAVEDYKSGKTNVVGFLIGQVQKELKGKGNPKDITDKLISFLQAK